MKRLLGPVLAAHYLAAFTALGMPLFLPQVLQQLAPGAAIGWSGVLYVLPTLCTALTASTWGRLADRYGRKRSLLRAQLGLALGFLMAGFAPNLGWLVVGLVVQGACGGSLAATNAYLSSQAQSGSLARALDWTQFSARLAMVTAPALLGLATALGPAQSLYRYLALLPLLAFALSWRLPADPPRVPAATTSTPSLPHTDAAQRRQRWALWTTQFLFCFAMVVTFPYFLPYAQAHGIGSSAVAGLLYSLPHLVYLVLMPCWRGRDHRMSPLPAGLALFALACLLQMAPPAPGWLIAARLLFGLGMWMALRGLNRSLAEVAGGRGAGQLFGRFDAAGKYAGVAGGALAGALVQGHGLAVPFLAAAAAALLALLPALMLTSVRRTVHVPVADA
ncbi:MFS transporter [Xanthomonas sacchari]|uniref:MFS transporter n=1 Tax=Xanthomonas sacchari TaxID=56458 RepID=UPI00225BEED2|nr:MFS transporter [Xanthomonas sacchari]MCW0452955.1 Multidrug resistance protein MdtG [Xanthomonas sacchari]